jgi:hypothetical protein
MLRQIYVISIAVMIILIIQNMINKINKERRRSMNATSTRHSIKNQRQGTQEDTWDKKSIHANKIIISPVHQIMCAFSLRSKKPVLSENWLSNFQKLQFKPTDQNIACVDKYVWQYISE